MLNDDIKNLIPASPGLYVISYKGNPWEKKAIKFKVGIAKNLQKRLDSYHTSYPDSFWIYAVITTKVKNKNDSNKLQSKDVENARKEAEKIERRVLGDAKKGKIKNIKPYPISNKHFYTARPNTGGEWVIGDWKSFEKYLYDIYNRNLGEYKTDDMVVMNVAEAKRLHT